MTLKLPPLHDIHSPMASFGVMLGELTRMLWHRIRVSDTGTAMPVLSLQTRAATIGLYVRLWHFSREFKRLLLAAMAGKLRVRPRRPADPTGPTAATCQDSAGEGLAGNDSVGGESAGQDPAAKDGAGGVGEKPGHDPRSDFEPRPVHDCIEGQPPLRAPPTRGFGWMLGYLPERTRDVLGVMIGAMNLRAMIETYPSVARLLRPLCRDMGLTLPDWFPAAPKYARKSRARPKSEHKRRRRPERSPHWRPNARQMRDGEITVSPALRHKRWLDFCRARDAAAAGETPRPTEHVARLAGAPAAVFAAVGGRNAKS